MVVQKDIGTCLLCVPLRLGVATFCLLEGVYACFCFAVLFLDDVRMQPSGYNPTTRRWENIVGSVSI